MLVPGYRELVMIKDQLRGIRTELRRIREMEAVRIVDFEQFENERYRDPQRLHLFAGSVNSQNGEDGMIQEILRRIGSLKQEFLEIGVGDGIENNTAFLLSLGWSGSWIDGDGRYTANIPKGHGARLNTHVGFVTAENVEQVLSDMEVSPDIDLMSLDVDQNTFHIWQAIESIKPRVVVVEYNATIPPGVEWQAAYDADKCWDRTINYGASLTSFEELGRGKGYSLVGCDFHGANAFFVLDALVSELFCKPFTASNHYEPPRYYLSGRRGHKKAILDQYVTVSRDHED
jgi:hypothetical protein